MSKRWFISDLHFGHGNILKYQGSTRTFPSVAAMDAEMISRWNKSINKRDVVYVIGDFSFYRDMSYNKQILSCLNGKKILIRGNHDLGETKELLDAGFDDVRDEMRMKISNGENVLLKHYPYDLPWWVYFYRKLIGSLGPWRSYYVHTPIDKGAFLIHGHHHGAPKMKRKMINVNVDSWDFKPVSESTICQMINNYKINKLSYKIMRKLKGWKKRWIK
jgi:calcineurin-like phosphoesterase family protein